MYLYLPTLYHRNFSSVISIVGCGRTHSGVVVICSLRQEGTAVSSENTAVINYLYLTPVHNNIETFGYLGVCLKRNQPRCSYVAVGWLFDRTEREFQQSQRQQYKHCLSAHLVTPVHQSRNHNTDKLSTFFLTYTERVSLKEHNIHKEQIFQSE